MTTTLIIIIIVCVVLVLAFLVWVMARSAANVKRLDPHAWERMKNKGRRRE